VVKIVLCPNDYPKIQILSIEELLKGEKIDYPCGARGMDATFRKAKRYEKKVEQEELFN
jgi:hypothetical protein